MWSRKFLTGALQTRQILISVTGFSTRFGSTAAAAAVVPDATEITATVGSCFLCGDWTNFGGETGVKVTSRTDGDDVVKGVVGVVGSNVAKTDFFKGPLGIITKINI